jgi:hypothetical protein
MIECREWRTPRWLVPLLLLAGAGCGGQSAEQQAAADATTRAAVQEMLQAYLPAFATAYRTGDLEPLRTWAVEKEIASLERRLVAMNEEGLSLEPTLVEVVVEDVQVWNRVNAFATTLETWDLRFLSSGAGVVVSERLGERQRVKYQLKLEGEAWMVYYREVGETIE